MLFYNSVNQSLKAILDILMQAEVLLPFRLVGGTALSLQVGHRESIDIDLFTDAPYKSIDFEEIEDYLKQTFPVVEYFSNLDTALGKSYTIGNNKKELIKLDLFYTDPFVFDSILIDDIRLATVEEIIAMKIDVIQRGGRKKDFWDLHELLDKYSISQMLSLHKRRYPYSDDKELIIHNLASFENADNDFDPICYRGKHWTFIKEDFIEAIQQLRGF